MKTLITGLVMATTVLFFAGCEKEQLNATSGKGPKKPNSATQKSYYGPTIDWLSDASSSICGSAICAAGEANPTSRYNLLRFANENRTAYPTVRVTIYKLTGFHVPTQSLIYSPIAQFTCSERYVNYAGSLIDDGTDYLVLISGTSLTAPSMSTTVSVTTSLSISYPTDHTIDNTYSKFTTSGNFEGDSCIIED